MPEVRITAEPRSEFGKGHARRTRRAGKVPAVLYGHGTDPRHLAITLTLLGAGSTSFTSKPSFLHSSATI